MKTSLTLMAALVLLLTLGFSNQNAFAEGAIAGVVLDADGEPVGGAHVMIQGEPQRRQRPYRAQTETNDEGGFGFRGVPAGRYMVTAMDRELGGARELVGVRDDNVTHVRLQLQDRGEREEPGVGTVGVIVVNADGEAVAGAHVMLTRAHRGRNHRMRPIRGVTNRRGVVIFEEVPEGNYMVTAGARGEGFARGRVQVVADEGVRVRLELRQRERDDDGGRGDRGNRRD